MRWLLASYMFVAVVDAEDALLTEVGIREDSHLQLALPLCRTPTLPHMTRGCWVISSDATNSRHPRRFLERENDNLVWRRRARPVLVDPTAQFEWTYASKNGDRALLPDTINEQNVQLIDMSTFEPVLCDLRTGTGYLRLIPVLPLEVTACPSSEYAIATVSSTAARTRSASTTARWFDGSRPRRSNSRRGRRSTGCLRSSCS